MTMRPVPTGLAVTVHDFLLRRTPDDLRRTPDNLRRTPDNVGPVENSAVGESRATAQVFHQLFLAQGKASQQGSVALGVHDVRQNGLGPLH